MKRLDASADAAASSRGRTRTCDPLINSRVVLPVSANEITTSAFGIEGKADPKRSRSSPDNSPDASRRGDTVSRLLKQCAYCRTLILFPKGPAPALFRCTVCGGLG